MPTIKYYKRIFNAYIFNKKQSNLSFWHTPLMANVLSKEDLVSVGRYPQNFIVKTRYSGETDENGVIKLNYYGELGHQYNLNAIAQIALGYYDLFLDEENILYKDSFLINANWFVKHGKITSDNIILWTYDFPWESREGHGNPPYRSALAQGQAISVLIRAHKITGDNKYAEIAQKGYNSFRYKFNEHEAGVVSFDSECWWLEESMVYPPTHILNGLIWALWGVYDYAKYFNDSHAENLFQNCVKTLEHNLHKWDLGEWTSYDIASGDDKGRPIMPASHYYQRLHIVQMESMYNLTGKEIFRKYKERWQKYMDSFYYRNKWLLKKIIFKLRYF